MDIDRIQTVEKHFETVQQSNIIIWNQNSIRDSSNETALKTMALIYILFFIMKKTVFFGPGPR